jgi:tRNA dimethylallyltransferase
MAVARAIARTEIVAVDAFQLYRGMDIGTAKPSAADRAEIPHHCLDLVDPSQEVTLARFLDAYDDAMTSIAAAGTRVLLVAGTGLYLRAAVDRLVPPAQWPSIRTELEADPDTAALHDRLRLLDAVAAARMEPSNRRRVIRALEVCLGSGRPFSSFGPGLTTYSTADVVQIGLRWPRDVLAKRIEARFHQLLAAGFLDEVRTLATSPTPLSRTARQAIGYAELFDHLAGGTSLDDAAHRAVARTRRFATRQERWFRRDPRIHWVDIRTDPLDAVPAVLGSLTTCV